MDETVGDDDWMPRRYGDRIRVNVDRTMTMGTRDIGRYGWIRLGIVEMVYEMPRRKQT